MNPQPDALHDRITALIRKAEASVRASFPPATAERMVSLDDTDVRLTLGDLRAVLAETPTAPHGSTGGPTTTDTHTPPTSSNTAPSRSPRHPTTERTDP